MFIFYFYTDDLQKVGLPAGARWPCCAASLGTAGPPGWARVVGGSDPATEGWTRVSGTGRPTGGRGQRGRINALPRRWMHWWSRVTAGPHLVGVHGEQGFVEVNGLELLLHQLVLNAFGVGQLHLLLRVKHVLVLLEEFWSRLRKGYWKTACSVLGLWKCQLHFLWFGGFEVLHAHLVYCDDIVGSYSKQPHICWPANLKWKKWVIKQLCFINFSLYE